MVTQFWKNLVIGNKTEEEVARWFESLGYSVWIVGGFRLPVDLYVWNDEREFFVQVKYRSKFIPKNRRDFSNMTWKFVEVMQETGLPMYLIVKTPDKTYIKEFSLKKRIVYELVPVGEEDILEMSDDEILFC